MKRFRQIVIMPLAFAGGGALLIIAFVIFTQDLRIFPGVLSTRLRQPASPPPGSTTLTATTADGETLAVWRAEAVGEKRPERIILFNGNAQSLPSSVVEQRWLAELGFTNFAFDYRGFGSSTGFPSEQGIYSDAEAVFDLVVKNESIKPRDVVVFGRSIGTGPASFIAQQRGVSTLVLISPYTSVPDIVRERPLLRFLVPFLWYEFPTHRYLAELKETCVVLAHGKRDTIISYAHSEQLKARYHGNHPLAFISSAQAGHQDILNLERERISEALLTCVSRERT